MRLAFKRVTHPCRGRETDTDCVFRTWPKEGMAIPIALAETLCLRYGMDADCALAVIHDFLHALLEMQTDPAERAVIEAGVVECGEKGMLPGHIVSEATKRWAKGYKKRKGAPR